MLSPDILGVAGTHAMEAFISGGGDQSAAALLL